MATHSLIPMVLIALLLLTGCAGKAVSITNDRTTPAIWRISNGTVQVTVDTAKSRISSYGYVGGRNVLWVNPDPGNEPINSTPGPNWGGDKVWIWPQSDWNWPPPLPESGYTASISRDGKTLVMKSSPITRYAVCVVREIELSPSDTTVTITTRLEPISPGTFVPTNPIGAWSVTQMPPSKFLLARISGAEDRTRYRERKPDGFESQPMGNGFVSLTRTATGNAKTFLDAELLAAVYDDLIFVERQIPAHTEGHWATDERTQVYQHGDGSFTELEWTAPKLAGNQVVHAPLRVTWSLVPSPKPLSAAAVVEKLK